MATYAVTATRTIKTQGGGLRTGQVPSFVLPNFYNEDQALAVARRILWAGVTDEDRVTFDVCAVEI